MMITLADIKAIGTMITFADIKVIGAATTALITSWWSVLAPVLEASIMIATAVYVIIRAYKAVRGFGGKDDAA